MIEQFLEGAVMAFRFDTIMMIAVGLFSGTVSYTHLTLPTIYSV